jgi:hypothetical protein
LTIHFTPRLLLLGLAVGFLASADAQAQTETDSGVLAVGQAPRVATRVGEKLNITVTATRIANPIEVDGRLDDEPYTSIEPISDFLQQEPQEGQPTTERTDVWVMFDENNFYVSAKCWDSHPEREVVTELRRDNNNIFQNESFTVVVDPFHDLRNGFMFQTNAIGGVRDQAIVDNVNDISWNTIWDVRTARYDWGWSVEIRVPFKSLRYPGAGPQVWGINFRRVIKWKNEFAYLTAIPASFGTNGALSRMGFAATLVGLETPQQSMNLELKPYVVSSLTSDRTATNPYSNDLNGDTGFDFKYGLTRGLIFDATVNTDFAQVEEDQQQVNLTRFNLFFPEKRDFFLEGGGVFAFGGVTSNSGNPGDVPVMFFSRQIGLSRGQAVPVVAGARLAGRTGKYQIGAVNVQTEDKASAGALSTNFTAVRVKRDFLRRSNVGVIGTRRSPSTAGSDTSLTYGADMNLFLFTNVSANAYYARTDVPGATDNQASYRGRFDYDGDRYGMSFDHLLIGSEFTPEVGYVRRTDFRRSFGQLRFSPRPQKNDIIRKYNFTGNIDYVTNARVTELQERQTRALLNIEYQNGDLLDFDYTRNYERVPESFSINPGTRVPAGSYNYQSFRAQYSLGTQRKVSGRISAERGSLYNGNKTEVGYSGRLGFIPQFVVEPSVSLNWVRLPYGDFSAPVVSSRIIVTPNARMAVSSFLQYNGGSRTLSSSVRLRWEYRGGSDLFIVYSDGRSTSGSGYPDLLNRSLAFKVTRLLRF